MMVTRIVSFNPNKAKTIQLSFKPKNGMNWSSWKALEKKVLIGVSMVGISDKLFRDKTLKASKKAKILVRYKVNLTESRFKLRKPSNKSKIITIIAKGYKKMIKGIENFIMPDKPKFDKPKEIREKMTAKKL